MDFFINIGIVGTAFIFLGKLTNKENKNIQEFNNLEFLNKLICLYGIRIIRQNTHKIRNTIIDLRYNWSLIL